MIVRQINNNHTLASSILHMVMPMAYAVKRNFRSQMHWWNDTAGASNVDIVLYIVYSKILLWEDTAIPKIFIPKIFFFLLLFVILCILEAWEWKLLSFLYFLPYLYVNSLTCHKTWTIAISKPSFSIFLWKQKRKVEERKIKEQLFWRKIWNENV